MTAVDMPPVGHYLADEVGRLAGVSGNTIGQWSRRGYIRASQVHEGYPLIYSYQDIAEAMAVHELRVRNVSYPRIKKTIAYLRDEYGDWPLSRADLLVGADRVAHERSDAIVIETARRSGQGILLPEDLVEISTALSRGGWAARKLTDLEYIEVNPERLSGRPTIKNRRIAAQDVAELAAGPDGLELLVEEYDLTPAEIRDAERWWAEVQKYDAA